MNGVRHIVPIVAAIALGGCASRSSNIAVVPPRVAAPIASIAKPAGAYPGMAVPAMLIDGTYPTPNRVVSSAAAMWHLRAALNVAALACRGAQETTTIAGYNTMLATQKAVLKSAEAALAEEYRAGGGDWRDRYDDAMTRLYNYFSQSFARDRFCATAAQTLAEAPGVAPAAFPAFAAERLALLDRPFTDFYRAYDAWRTAQTLPMAPRTQPVMATVSSPVPVAARRPAPTKIVPRLELDLSDLGE